MEKTTCLLLCLVLSFQTFAQSKFSRCPQGLHKDGEYIVRYWEHEPSQFEMMSVDSSTRVLPDRILFRGHPDVPQNFSGIPQIMAFAPSAVVKSTWPNLGVFRNSTDADMEKLAQLADVESAEENCFVHLHAASALAPNDPDYAKQWALPRVQAPEGWQLSTGSSSVIVAVIDSGIDIQHTDLQSNVWVNTVEQSGLSGIDDDRNGYVDDIYGYNFADGNANPVPGNGADDAHGTHIAGIIGAKGNNGVGVAGLSWNVRLMSVRVFPSTGSGTIAEMLEGVYYAVNNGARIINCSWGGVGPSTQSERQAFGYALSKDVLPVIAAGNNALDSAQSSPANIPGVLVVGASDASDDLANFSNYGDGVQLLAPGSGIYSTFPQSQYNYMTGTSMAAPFVAGAAALLLSVNPNLSEKQLQQLLIQSAQALTVTTSPGGNVRSQYPLLNVAAALQLAGESNSTSLASVGLPSQNSQTALTSNCVGACETDPAPRATALKASSPAM